MLTQAKVQLPAALGGVPSVTAVDTKQVALPISVSALPVNVSHRQPYVRDGKIFVDVINAGPSALSVDLVFLKSWKHFL